MKHNKAEAIMKSQSLLYGIIGFLSGIIITIIFLSLTTNNMMHAPMNDFRANNYWGDKSTDNHGSMSMHAMTRSLENLSGDAYDEAFINMMIPHHDGAIDMAQLSETRAKHPEIKQLSKDIIASQQKEISDMIKWQKEWNYKTDNMMDMMHGQNH